MLLLLLLVLSLWWISFLVLSYCRFYGVTGSVWWIFLPFVTCDGINFVCVKMVDQQKDEDCDFGGRQPGPSITTY
jgi:hypothetical protein